MSTPDLMRPAERRPVSGRALGFIALLTLVLSVAIALDVTPWLRGPSGTYEWRWGYHPFVLRPLFLLPVALVAALLGGWYGVARRHARVGAWWVAALVPIGLALQLAVLATGPSGLDPVSRVLNPGFFGYYPPATAVEDLATFVGTYADEQASFTHPRLQTHPPGNVVFHWLVLRSVEAIPALTGLTTPLITPRLGALPEWIADYSLTEITGAMVVSVLIPAIGALAVIPLFLLARDGFGEETARRSALLYLLAPSLTLFGPKIDVLYTLLTGLAFLLAYRGAQRDRVWLILLSGLVCSVGTFMSYSLLPLTMASGLFVAATTLKGWRQDRRAAAGRLVARVLAFGVGAVGAQTIAWLTLGFDPIAAFGVMLNSTSPYNAARNYWYSLFYTPYDMLLFAGVPVAALLVWRLVRLLRAAMRRAWPADVDWLLVGSLLAMIAMILTGVQKAENARVFVYFMPVIVLFGAAQSEDAGIDARPFVALAALTFTQLMVFQAVLEVFL